jgi:uncharacterized protein
VKDLLNYLVSELVDEPEHVAIRESAGQKNVAYIVTVAPDDIGKVIGKGGRIANAVRVVLRAAGALTDKAIWVDFNGR